MALSVVDAGVLIGFLDGNDAHHPAADAWLREAVDRSDRLTTPSSVLAEVLVGPSRRGVAAVSTVCELLDRVPIDVIGIGRDIAITAAALRAKHRSLRLPDALVVATGIELDADTVVTTDRRWPTRSKLGLRAGIIRL
jgi:predicted nucleic acid-binding protein